MIKLPTYATVKDKYCIAYFGNNHDYLVQLRLLRPFMEKTYPGIQVYIAYRDDTPGHIFHNTERTLTRSQLQETRHEFAYVRELTCNMISHPVEDFMDESNIPCGPVPVGQTFATNVCVLVTTGMLPTRSLSRSEIEDIKTMVQSEGCIVQVDGDINQAQFVIGVENEKLFEAGARGCMVSLIPTGNGENLFKRMYPKGKVLKI